MLTKLRIQNFKCLQDTGHLDIRPLTFLVGPNSSGKSSILQMLSMLRQTALGADIESALVTNGALVEVGAYPDFVFRHELEREIEGETEWSLVGLTPSRELERVPGLMSFNTVFRYDRATTQIRLKESRFDWRETFGQSVHEEFSAGSYLGRTWGVENGKPVTNLIRGARPVPWFLEAYAPGQFYPETVVFATPSACYRWHLERLAHLGPLRPPPKPVYPMTGQTPGDVGLAGERASDVLWNASKAANGEGERLLSAVRRWIGGLAIGENLELHRLGESNLYQVVMTDPATRTQVTLRDVGFGASQVLPIVVQSFCARPGSTLLIEQPEIHLHPMAQAKLGDLFIEAVQGNDRAFVIETHSEHILARVRRRIAERKPGLTREKVAIYYFKPTPDGTQIEEVTLNDDGQYVDFPPGFFEEDVDEAFEHLRAMSEHA